MDNISLVYLNGEFIRPEKATISAFDRGFIFGDGVYEVIPVFGGRAFRLPQHLARLKANLAATRISNPLSNQAWQELLTRLIAGFDDQDQSIYLQVTRGVAKRDHSFPADTQPTVFAYAQNTQYPDQATVEHGITAITLEDYRWQHCDIKAIALLPNVMLRQQATEQGAAEAILLRDGMLTEGAASNIFVVKDNQLLTPAKGPSLLPGITRDLILELAKQHGIACQERAITRTELFEADELWLSSSTKEILPLIQLDDMTIANGQPGALYKQMLTLYRAYKQAFREGQVS